VRISRSNKSKETKKGEQADKAADELNVIKWIKLFMGLF